MKRKGKEGKIELLAKIGGDAKERIDYFRNKAVKKILIRFQYYIES